MKHHQSHNEHHGGCCGHTHNNKRGIYINLICFALAIGLFILGFWFQDHRVVYLILNLTALVLAGYHVTLEGISATIKNSIKKKRFYPNVHILMILAAIGAVIIGEYYEAVLLIIIFAGAHLLEDYAQSKSQREITKLLNLNPKTARRVKPDGVIEMTLVSALKVGDILEVLQGDLVPTDGLIIKGSLTIDESVITGEALLVDRLKDDKVFGATLVKQGYAQVVVTKDPSESIYAKIIDLVSQTQANVSKTAVFIQKVEPIYVTIILLLTPVFYLIGFYLMRWGADLSFYQTMVFLISASPCALAVTDIPASLSAVSNLARKGILFKGTNYLNLLAKLAVVAFDKTNTLTNGEFIVDGVLFEPSLTIQQQRELIDLLVGIEKTSNHPLAAAIINHFEIDTIKEVEATYEIGVGLKAFVDKAWYHVGKEVNNIMVSNELKRELSEFSNKGTTKVYLTKDQQLLMIVSLVDTIKVGAKETIEYFNQQKIKTVLITGDNEQSGLRIQKELGIKKTYANVLPHEKSSIISDLKNEYGITAMIGDGINDAPALAIADIGLAMKKGADIAIEAADAVVMSGNVASLKSAHLVSKRLRGVIIQNIVFACGVILFLIISNFFQLFDLSSAVIMHEGSTLLVILSGLRMLINHPNERVK